MWVAKCDLCKKKIKGEVIMASCGFYTKIELCQKCGLPILKFLNKHKPSKKKQVKKP